MPARRKRDVGRNTRVLDDTDERYPIFRGTLPTDITFLGFNLSLDDARGGTPASPEGFFFVFQEQPSEPRFGLEPTERQQSHHALGRPRLDQLRTAAARAAAVAAIFKLPDLGNTTRGQTIANSPWRLASQVFSLVVSRNRVPDFLSPNAAARRELPSSATRTIP